MKTGTLLKEQIWRSVNKPVWELLIDGYNYTFFTPLLNSIREKVYIRLKNGLLYRAEEHLYLLLRTQKEAAR